ncbi:MAG: hypothetical protein LPK49_03850, partial [Bacteroidota bacterium]|nr:hypothetical protein [Bacteroidota bacterium]MDX5430153.1 hypothetical protein [Bacteroidota bacterium]
PQSVFGLKYWQGKLISSGNEGQLRMWDEQRILKEELSLSEKSLRCLYLENEELTIAGSEGKAWRLNLLQRQIEASWEMSTNSVFALEKRGDQLISAGRDAHIHYWQDEQRVKELEAHWYSIHALALSPDENYLASGSMDKSIKIWDAASGTLLKVIDRERYGAHTSSVNAIVWLDNETFVSCSDDRTVMAFRIS